MNTLIINPGSTAIKYIIFSQDGKVLKKKKFLLIENKEESIFLKSLKDIKNIGIRIVHGGKITGPIKINNRVKKEIEKFQIFAPVHNKIALEVLEKINQIFKCDIYAVFDTDFHQTIPEVNYTLSINKKIAQKYDLRKYGFHGIAIESILENLKKKNVLKKTASKIICVHLGGGSSVTAVKNGKSIYNSMGLTPLSGIIGKTRSGNIDADIFSVLTKQGFSIKKISEILSHQSGFLGLTGSIDTKKIIEKAKTPKQGLGVSEKLVYQIYLNQISAEIATAMILISGCDLITLSGGIGEKNKFILNDLYQKLKIIGIQKKQIIQVESNEEKLIFEILLTFRNASAIIK